LNLTYLTNAEKVGTKKKEGEMGRGGEFKIQNSRFKIQREPATSNKEPATSNKQQGTRNQQTATSNKELYSTITFLVARYLPVCSLIK